MQIQAATALSVAPDVAIDRLVAYRQPPPPPQPPGDLFWAPLLLQADENKRPVLCLEALIAPRSTASPPGVVIGQIRSIDATRSIRLNLLPPPNSCWERLSGPAGSFPNYMSLRGWFEGPSTLMATSIEGTYWEGAFSDPCAGPVLLSIDTAGPFSST